MMIPWISEKKVKNKYGVIIQVSVKDVFLKC